MTENMVLVKNFLAKTVYAPFHLKSFSRTKLDQNTITLVFDSKLTHFKCYFQLTDPCLKFFKKDKSTVSDIMEISKMNKLLKSACFSNHEIKIRFLLSERQIEITTLNDTVKIDIVNDGVLLVYFAKIKEHLSHVMQKQQHMVLK